MATSQEYAAWLRANQNKQGTPDYQTVLRAFQEARLEELQAQAAPPSAQPQPESGFGPAFRAGVEGLLGAGTALAGRAGLMDMAEAEKAIEARRQRQAEIFKPTEEWGITKLTELLGGSIPYMAAPLAAAGAAAALPLTGTAAAVAGLGAAGLTSATQFTGTNLSRQIEEGKKLADTDLGAAALAAIPQAALDTLSLRMLPGVGKLLGDAGIKVTKETAKEVSEQILKKAAIDYTTATGRAMTAEGLTEAAQQGFERLQAGLSLTDADARKEYFDSLVGGALLGGTIAPAGRMLERGKAKREVAAIEQEEAGEAAKAARAAEEERKQQPEYALQLDADYQAAVARMKELQAAMPKKPAKGALPEEQMAYAAAVEERNKHLKEVLQPLAAEYVPRKAEIAQLKERQRIERLTPLEYQMEQAGVDITAPPEEERVFTGEEDLTAPVTPEVPPEAAYAQQQMDLARNQDLGTFDVSDYAQYLMQDPVMAQALVDNKTPIPGVSKQESAAILGGIKLQLREQEQQKQARIRAELEQQQEDLAAQQRAVKTDTLDLWKASIEETEEQATEELLRPNFETIRPSGPAVVKTPENILPLQNAGTLLRRIDDLFATRDQADKATDIAFGSGNKEAGTKKSQEREAAQASLNAIEQTEGPGRALVALRKAQDTALMNTAQLTDDLRVGRTLGGPEAGTASSTPQTLINQINRERDAFVTAAVQEAATARKLFGKALTQEEATKAADQMRSVFNEWVTRTIAEPRGAVLEERVLQPAQMRGAEVVRGAETELVDPRPLEERRFGAYREATQVLQEQLRQIAAGLTSVPRDVRRVEAGPLKMQFPETEAAKVAEARGETAKTLEGALRRRRDYVSNLIDQAFQTRRVPGIAQTLLTRAQDFMPSATGDFLDAAENIADRLIRGQNIERGDLVKLRDELRAASARPGEAEVVGEREGQAELFAPETAQAERRAAETRVEKQTRPLDEKIARVRQQLEQLDAVKSYKSPRDAALAIKRKTAFQNLLDSYTAQKQALVSEGQRAQYESGLDEQALRKEQERLRGDVAFTRTTAARFANAPAVKQGRAALKRGQELLENIKAAWRAVDRRRAGKIAKAESAVKQQREDYRAAFTAALNKARLDRVVEKFQPQIDVAIQQLAAFGKERAKALAAKDAVAARDIQTIMDTEREALQELRQQLAAAMQAPGSVLESAEMTDEKQVRGFTQPEEIAAAADVWVKFERDALAKAEAKLAKLKGPDKAPQVRAVAEQRAAVKTAEDITQRARTGLGLPGIRVERQAVAAEIAALAERIPKIKDPKKKRKAEERLARLEMTRREAPEEIKPSSEVADEQAARAAEERKAEREAAEVRRKEKETERSQLEDRALTLASEIEDLRDARERARTPVSKERIQGQIDERSKEVMLLQAQLETPNLTRTEKRKARKAQKTLYSSKGVRSENELLTSIAQKLQDKKPLSAYEKRIWEGRSVKKSGISAEGKKALAAASEAQRKEREEAQRPAGTFGEALGVEDVLSSFNVGGKDVYSSRGATAEPSTADSVRAELKQAFPDLGRVQIYDSVDALIAANPQYKGKIPSDARGFVDTAGNKAFLIAENINQGQALSVLLHEVGAHIGLKNALGEAQYNALVGAVKTWEKRNDGSKEAQVAKAARARVEAAETSAGQVNDELLAYAIEEAVNAGVKPTETKGVLGQWLGRVAQLFRRALEKFGLPPKTLDAQGIVDMAFGAAKMEMQRAAKTRMYHGSPNAQLKELRGLTFVTPNKQVAEQYANGEVAFTGRTEGSGGRVYEVEVDTTNALDFNKPEHRAEYERARKQWNETRDADERLPALTSPGFISSKTGYPSYGRVADILAAMPAFDSMFVDEGSQGFSLAVRDGRKLAAPAETGSPSEILFSRNLPTAARVANDLIGKQPTWLDNLKANFLGLGARTQFIDKYAPTEEALKRGKVEELKANQARYYLRMYDQRMHFTSQAISDGAPVIVEKTRRDGRVERVVETAPGASISKVVDLLKRKDVIKEAGSADAANKLFTLYLAAIRGERVGFDKLNFSKINEADIKAAKAEIDANPVLSEAFREARDIYNAYNRDLMKFAMDTGAIGKELGNKLLSTNDYIPYYRMRDGVAQLMIGGETPIRIGNIKDSPHLQELVGGDEAIFDFLTSSVQNTSMLLDMSMKNLATKNLMFELRDVGLAKISKVKGGNAPTGSVTFKKDGEEYFAVVDTDALGIDSELLVKGLAGIPTMFPQMVRVLGMPARLLRRLIVASPVYMARQLVRDSTAAAIASGANMMPLISAVRQIGKPSVLERRGITGGQVFTGMPEDQTRLLKEMQAGKIGLTSGLARLEALSAKVDALTREAQYESYREQGLSEMEATLMALESMNFSRRGLSPTMHMLSTLIPFFNAQIQGLDVLYRSLRGHMPFNEQLEVRKKLITRGAMLFGMSMVYAAMMQDDEAYKNAKVEEKYSNFFMPIPGTDQLLRIPIPFELGYIFKALPEALVNTFAREEGGEEALKALTFIAKQTVPGLSSYFLPQAIKPALEVALDQSIYTGRDIESAQEKLVESGYRFRDNTTELAREVGEQTGVSPIKLEYLIRGYTGSMGMALVQAVSAPFGRTGPESATKRPSDVPVVGTLFQPADASGIIDSVYERMNKARQVQETYESLVKKGRQDAAQAYLDRNLDSFALASLAGSFKQQMGEITKYEQTVRASNLTADQKREALDRARQAKINLAKAVRAASDRTERQAAPA